MSTTTRSYQVLELTPERRVWINTLDLTSGQKHSMYGLLEVDVTFPRQILAEHKTRTGERLSFTGFLTYCLAQAVDDDKTVQAYLKGGKQLVLFDDVDVGLMIERKVGDKPTLMGYTLRGANHKTYRQIHEEIRSVQEQPVPQGKGMPAWFRSAMLLPWPLSGWFKSLFRAFVRNNPVVATSMAGTVSVTSVGMFGEGNSGWGIYSSSFALELVVGSIAWKPAAVEGRIELRQILNLTVIFDHNVIDGAPAARFVRRLVELIESGYGLDESDLQAGVIGETTPIEANQTLEQARIRKTDAVL